MVKRLDRSLLEDGVAYVDRWLEFQSKTLRAPGFTVGIRHSDDMLLEKAYGLANIESETAMEANHVFRIASHSKTFTATSIMLLKERGLLSLDDRIETHLPKVTGPLGKTTIRQVLSHSAGTPRETEDSSYWYLLADYPNEAELVEAAATTEMTYASNDRFKYSNFGYSVVGLIITAVSGLSFEDFVSQNIIDPLGMTNTVPDLTDEILPQMATGYSPEFYGFERRAFAQVKTNAYAPATGLCSTVRDLCTYGAAHFLGSGFLSDDIKREMQHPVWDIKQSEHKYGLGFETVKIGERQMFGHGGGFPGFTTFTLIDSTDQLVVTILFNATGTPAEEFGTSIVKILDRALQCDPADKGARNRLDKYVGRFFGDSYVDDFLRFGTTLLCVSPMATNPVWGVTELEVVDADTLKITDCGDFYSPGELVRYDRDQDGSVKRIKYASGWEYPLEDAIRVFGLEV